MRLLISILLCLSFSVSAQTFSRSLAFHGNANARASTASYVLYTNYSATSSRANYSGLVGQLWTNSSAITVNELGRWVTVVASHPRTIYLVKWSDKSIKATAILNSSNATVSTFTYTNITPVVLEVSTVYAFVCTETNVTTSFQDAAPTTRGIFSSGVYGGAVYSATYSVADLAYTDQARPFGPLNLKWTP